MLSARLLSKTIWNPKTCRLLANPKLACALTLCTHTCIRYFAKRHVNIETFYICHLSKKSKLSKSTYIQNRYSNDSFVSTLTEILGLKSLLYYTINLWGVYRQCKIIVEYTQTNKKKTFYLQPTSFSIYISTICQKKTYSSFYIHIIKLIKVGNTFKRNKFLSLFIICFNSWIGLFIP